MDVISKLMHGFSVAVTPVNLIYAFVGALVGTLIGVLPGIGPLGAMAILLSYTLSLNPVTAMILFAGIYYGSMYGGSTTSILLNIPGESASVVTAIDGFKMAQKGRAGAALTVSAIGSFIAGTISIIGLMFLATTLADTALKFGAPEYFAIAVVGLIILSRLQGGSLVKSLMMMAAGLMLSTVGTDQLSGKLRFTFGNIQLGQGIDFLPVAMGLFGIAEVLSALEEKAKEGEIFKVGFRDMFPTLEEWKRSIWPIIRGSFLGFGLGLLPGPSPVISTFASYAMEKKLSKHPEEFGEGAIEAVAGPEAANNAAVGGAYVPLMALGIPFTPAMAMVLGALMLHGVTPGPLMMEQSPDLFWGVVASMYIGNFMLLVLNLPLVGLFTSILKVPQNLLLPLVIVFCLVGVYSLNTSFLDLWVLVILGLLGHLLRKLDFDIAPFVLALVIGPTLETNLRQSMTIFHGDFTKFFTRPLSGTMLWVAVIVLIFPLIKKLFPGKGKAATEAK